MLLQCYADISLSEKGIYNLTRYTCNVFNPLLTLYIKMVILTKAGIEALSVPQQNEIENP